MVSFEHEMLQLPDLLLLAAAIVVSFRCALHPWPWIVNPASKFAIPAIFTMTFLGCLAVAMILFEPVPRVPDEFSYLLMADTFAHGHVAGPAPKLYEFFESFHILVHPVYASKYFPAQGVFLAIGEVLTGHPAVGLWLSCALACAATVWMLQAWIGPRWALLGGLLMVLKYGAFSYWSQTYWGGMVAALGGALFFGAARRLWDRLNWQNSFVASLGLVILANSRPLEGAIAALPATLTLLHHASRHHGWKSDAFWNKLVLPGCTLLAVGAFVTGAYNRAITGSALQPPYVLHESQYQESPPFVFLPLRPPITYNSPRIAAYYHGVEVRQYARLRIPTKLAAEFGRRMNVCWSFYCGALLSAPLVLPGILKPRTRYWQVGLLAALPLLSMAFERDGVAVRLPFDVLVLVQIGVLYFVFDGYWQRLAIATWTLLILEMLFLKATFIHYFAPAACLLLYLQLEGLARLWHWQPGPNHSETIRGNGTPGPKDPANISSAPLGWRNFVLLLPLVCLTSLGWHVALRTYGLAAESLEADQMTLPRRDWSLQRAHLERWLEGRPEPQLVFVRYPPGPKVESEWVYNHADLFHAHVVWARDFGTEHNRLLLQDMPGRTAWLLEADTWNPQLVPYGEAGTPARLLPSETDAGADEKRLNW